MGGPKLGLRLGLGLEEPSEKLNASERVEYERFVFILPLVASTELEWVR